MIETITFYLFATVLVASAIMVISAKNPVHSVLFLILAFFNSAGLFIMLGAEFIAMILVIVYVGAVAVLFLFVVMMLDISFTDLRQGAMKYVPVGIMIGGILLAELFMLYPAWASAPWTELNFAAPIPVDKNNAESLGALLYTDYIYVFQGAGLILLIAMIGAIVLTHRQRSGVRKQKVADQFAVRPEDAMEIKKITPGTGV